MSGKKDAMLPIHNIFLKHLYDLCPHNRVQTIRSFIQNQYTGIPAEYRSKHQLHLHASGVIGNPSLGRKLPVLHHLIKLILLKARIHHLAYCLHILEPKCSREVRLISDKSNTFQVPPCILFISNPTNGYHSRILMTQMGNQIQRGRLPRSVLSDIPHDKSFWKAKGYVL